MPLVKTLSMLENASLQKYAVGAFNVNSLDQPQAIIKKADSLKSPVLVVVPGAMEQYIDFNDFATITMRAAEKASIPVGIHLSHGEDIAMVERAAKAGFTSVMFDGSKMDYEDNIKHTAEAVKVGQSFGAAVEGELGALGSSFENVSESMTDPSLAQDYVKRTGIDILAVAIGNSHGFYKGKPSLDFKTLEQVKNAIDSTGAYLTLHGGSGIPKEHIKRAIKGGISKICVYTEMCVEGKKNAVSYCSKKPNYEGDCDIPELIKSINRGFCDMVEYYIDMYGSSKNLSITEKWQLAQAKDYKLQPKELSSEFAPKCNVSAEEGTNIKTSGALACNSIPLNIAQSIEHCLLNPRSKIEEARILCDEARRYGFGSICIVPWYVSYAAEQLKGIGIEIATIIGIPGGYATTPAKGAQAREAVRNGATIIDIAVDVEAVKSGNIHKAKNDIEGIIAMTHYGSPKFRLILENDVYSKEEKIKVCDLVMTCSNVSGLYISNVIAENKANAKMITDFRSMLGEDKEIKISGNISELYHAQELIAAGANWIGTSASLDLLK